MKPETKESIKRNVSTIFLALVIVCLVLYANFTRIPLGDLDVFIMLMAFLIVGSALSKVAGTLSEGGKRIVRIAVICTLIVLFILLIVILIL